MKTTTIKYILNILESKYELMCDKHKRKYCELYLRSKIPTQEEFEEFEKFEDEIQELIDVIEDFGSHQWK